MKENTLDHVTQSLFSAQLSLFFLPHDATLELSERSDVEEFQVHMRGAACLPISQPSSAERQDTHEEAFLHSSAKQSSSNLSVWDFPPGLQLHSLISPKATSNHICHIYMIHCFEGEGEFI
ncbi:hypothetical protein WMY93_009506 [Mugilogobius chulae]|uniref:Uncharacterized protein n=1 Tax=Mugilogobius chulae TaxID=88201 RepID=A0AAW0PQA8_9GOBI